MKFRLTALLFCSVVFFQHCTSKTNTNTTKESTPAAAKSNAAPAADTVSAVEDAATIAARKEVPILCYHHIRDWKPNESSGMKDLLVPVATFRQQIKALADSGYHTISPDQLYAYLGRGAALPSKPVIISFDDTDEEQYTIGAAELEKYGFKGLYFIMTISIGRPRYMSKEQIKELSDKGHTIAAHTWDHHNVKQYADKDYDIQFAAPKKKIEDIVGKPVNYFAYPFGVWKEDAIPELRKRGYKAAFQLSTKIDPKEPLYTIRRMIVPGAWSPASMIRAMNQTFHQNR